MQCGRVAARSTAGSVSHLLPVSTSLLTRLRELAAGLHSSSAPEPPPHSPFGRPPNWQSCDWKALGPEESLTLEPEKSAYVASSPLWEGPAPVVYEYSVTRVQGLLHVPGLHRGHRAAGGPHLAPAADFWAARGVRGEALLGLLGSKGAVQAPAVLHPTYDWLSQEVGVPPEGWAAMPQLMAKPLATRLAPGVRLLQRAGFKVLGPRLTKFPGGKPKRKDEVFLDALYLKPMRAVCALAGASVGSYHDLRRGLQAELADWAATRYRGELLEGVLRGMREDIEEYESTPRNRAHLSEPGEGAPGAAGAEAEEEPAVAAQA
ncbi:hypothetical protein APUTEX25_001456 [Auxenochlorella protothecoides]|uniref:Uncharacterized protein n=1 Tax=Auxenochlorella protothecoides TaxID=3075 RepID=A0A3M7KUS9_AUXPR|nr:hypothetical protein APUTEX25_001456 [Auxenochlorella protothecoides]|eukprot:RMZ54298.1 hypothetical protein APUTEX25_001456 [Auxenochlorella protothecoides]